MLFPRAVARLRPDLVMSPYHDVRMPKGIPSVIGVHDLCLDELAGVYPARIRGYYLTMLRTNLRRASHVITVSQTSGLEIPLPATPFYLFRGVQPRGSGVATRAGRRVLDRKRRPLPVAVMYAGDQRQVGDVMRQSSEKYY
jgi:hypothetical protein